MQVILFKGKHEHPAPALLEVLHDAGVRAMVSVTTEQHGGDVDDEGEPLFVIYEVADGADVNEIHAALSRVVEAWPGAMLIASRRPTFGHAKERMRHLDAAALLRLGFHAVADEPAQVPALLRELETSGEQPTQATSLADEMESVPPALLLPDHLNVASLRAAFEMVASLHFITDQKSAAQTALAGLSPLVRADRWTIYLVEAQQGNQSATFEPLAARGLTERERVVPEQDWQRALRGDASIFNEAESRAARAAVLSTETIRKSEGDRRVLAVPLISNERVLGVLEAVREGASVKSFTAHEATLLSALALPLAAALANSVRIAEAERLSLTDDLTKLHNARFLRQYLIAEIKRARRYDSTVTVLFLDLDDFKEVNDEHGHLVGSHILMEMASVILMGVRDTDVVARYGGDEFVVILPETNTEMAARVAERIREKIASHAFTGGRNLGLKLTASFGVASFPQHSQSPQQLIADADAAMYEAKAARKNCVRLAAENQE